MNDLGTYVHRGGRPAVRFARDYAVPIDRLWRAVTDPAELSAWFPSAVSHGGRAGSDIYFSSDPYTDDVTGRVLVWDPPRAFGFTWGDDEIHLELSATDTGCRLVLIDVLEAEDTAARNASGWCVCLAELRKHLAGEPSRGPHSPDALPFPPLYTAHRDAGLPSGAAVPTPA